MRILSRGKFRRGPIHVCNGDILSLTHTDRSGTETLVSTPITLELAGVYDEGVLFEDVFEGRKAVGGLFLEQQR